MRKPARITAALFLIVASLIGLATCGARYERVPAENLLIDDLSLFPTGWNIKSPPQAYRDPYILIDQGAVDWAGVGFAPPNARFGSPNASQLIWNFGSSLDAAWEFRRRFKPPESSFSIEELGGRTYQSAIADRFQLNCENRVVYEKSWTDCAGIGQYGEYISVFSAPIGDEYHMTPEDFVNILRAIDEHIAISLNAPTP